MEIEAKLLEMLSSNSPQVRYMALEQLRDSKVTSEAIVEALDKATCDENKAIADQAINALQTEVHHNLAIKMGISELNQTIEPTQSKLHQTTATISPTIETTKSKMNEVQPIDIPFTVVVPNWLLYCQAITFFFSSLALITSIIEGDSSEFINGDGRIYLLVILTYLGFQLYAIRKFGFKE